MEAYSDSSTAVNALRCDTRRVDPRDSAAELEKTIERYNDAWNAQDVETIVSLHAPEMVFENHTASERAEGEAVRGHVEAIFAGWPDIGFTGRRLYVREGLVVQEWTARATHIRPVRRGDLVAQPTGKMIEWDGLDVIPFANGLITRKDVYSDSISILRQVGLIT